MDYFDEVLHKARATYGNKNQILVCIEELNELACVLAKYPRYDDENKATSELYNQALDEVADVVIILSHVKEIFNMPEKDIYNRIKLKVDRLNRWLSHSSSMQETVDDRVILDPCMGCVRHNSDSAETVCNTCISASATDGKYRPFYKSTK